MFREGTRKEDEEATVEILREQEVKIPANEGTKIAEAHLLSRGIRPMVLGEALEVPITIER